MILQQSYTPFANFDQRSHQFGQRYDPSPIAVEIVSIYHLVIEQGERPYRKRKEAMRQLQVDSPS
jgi:hypothetical protein